MRFIFVCLRINQPDGFVCTLIERSNAYNATLKLSFEMNTFQSNDCNHIFSCYFVQSNQLNDVNPLNYVVFDLFHAIGDSKRTIISISKSFSWFSLNGQAFFWMSKPFTRIRIVNGILFLFRLSNENSH